MATINKWQPGKLYQPGSLCQPNAGPPVTQTELGNDTFESGPTGWTLDATFSYVNDVPNFAGNWHLHYDGAAGAAAAIMVMIGTDGGTNVYRSVDSGTNWVDTVAESGTMRYVTANSTVFVAGSASEVWTSADGFTWASRTISWSADNMDGWFWDETTQLFYAFEALNAKYNTSPDGVAWTNRNFPFDDNNSFHTVTRRPHATDGTLLVVGLIQSGRIYTTTDGINWTLRTSSPADLVSIVYATGLGKFFATESDQTVWSSSNGTSWSEEVTADLDTTLSAGSAHIAWSPTGSVLCAMVNASTNTGASTTKIATSSDGITWSVQSGFEGNFLQYSPLLDKFICNQNDDDSSGGHVYSSGNGVSWAEEGQFGGALAASYYGIAEKEDAAVATYAENDTAAITAPGQTIRAHIEVLTGSDSAAAIGIAWYDSVPTLIKQDFGDAVAGASTVWREAAIEANAPSGAAFAHVVVRGFGSSDIEYDSAVWEYAKLGDTDGLVFEATQADAGYSDTAEPDWPTSVGATVVDNEVTWTGRAANHVVLQAFPILQSGSTEPTWPEEIGGGVPDNTIKWIAEDLRVKDENCPNTKTVAIAASKVFAGDDDIVAFSATINPLDWSSLDDSGFIPFGLNTYGSQPITGLGLYRSNLVVWNNKAFQMWQVDEDPANFAILDAVPIGNPYYKSGQAVSNDLVFLTQGGVRSMGIAGASTNLQAGTFGKQIDPLVLAEIKAIADNDNIISLYFPGAGQYWLIFEETAYVLTMNGGKGDMSWSTYVFPSAIDDWTILDTDLYLRSGDKVWKFDAATLRDDEGDANVVFNGEVWWPYLDFGALGQTKQMIGFDTVATGEYSVVFGYNQNNAAHVTTSYTISDGDTLVGDMIPLPIAAPSIQMRLTFTGNTAWEWSASALYLQDWRRTS